MADFGGADLDAFRSEARQWLAANFPKSLAHDREAADFALTGAGQPSGDLALWKQRMGEKGWARRPGPARAHAKRIERTAITLSALDFETG